MWTIIDKIGAFFIKLIQATKFAVLEYDSQLQMTKSPRQRLLIWLTVFLLVIVGIIFLIFVLNLLLDSFSHTFFFQKNQL
jgi:lipopolysaccharide/colanic/teichoic acid biosynthesis glycosyltransferase